MREEQMTESGDTCSKETLPVKRTLPVKENPPCERKPSL
jgi:hypothetical protein